MNDDKIKELLKNDKSVPSAPINELSNIYREIEEDSKSFMDLFSVRNFALACSLVLVIFGAKISLNNISNPDLISEREQEELIEYMLSDGYLNDSESSYAWVDSKY